MEKINLILFKTLVSTLFHTSQNTGSELPLLTYEKVGKDFPSFI